MKSNVLLYWKNLYNWKNPLNWWRLPGCWCRAIKYGWQRATKGFSDLDCWDLDKFYLNLLSNSLKEFAKNRFGSPDTEYDKWTKKYLEIADCFYRAIEENEYYKNEWEEDWNNCLKEIGTDIIWNIENQSDEIKDLEQAHFEREEEIFICRDNDMKEGFDKLKEVFWTLWD